MLLLWMSLQLISLSLSAMRVPLYARFPQPVERQATIQLLATQIMASALLFPVLLRDWRSLVLAVAGTWPLVVLANLMGGETTLCAVNAVAYVTLWLATLALWNWILTGDSWRALAVTVPSLWAIGGPLLLYFHIEATGTSGLWPSADRSVLWATAGGPMWAEVDRLWGSGWIHWSDIPLIAAFFSGFLMFAVRVHQARSKRDKLSTEL